MTTEQRAHDLAIATVIIMGCRRTGDIDVASLYDNAYQKALKHLKDLEQTQQSENQ